MLIYLSTFLDITIAYFDSLGTFRLCWLADFVLEYPRFSIRHFKLLFSAPTRLTYADTASATATAISKS